MEKVVLIIEDHDEMRENMAEILELADYTVYQASNGKEGVSRAKEIVPDLILCDIMMPELDGYGVLNILSENELTRTIPFIFLTAKAEKEAFRKGLSMGADDYLTKPFEDTELLDAIDMRLRKHRLRIGESEGSKVGFRRIGDLIDDWMINRPSSSYQSKQVIFREGSYPREAYLLKNGKVKLFKTNQDGKEYIVELIAPGTFFGHLALLEKSQYAESAVVLEDADICPIPEQEFTKVLHGTPELSTGFIQILSNNIKEKEERLLKLAYSSVRQRVADALLLLHHKYAQETDVFQIKISRDDLAGIVGTATESLIRTLSDFKDEEMIAVKGSEISILDLTALQKLAR